jgi:hypothetical protein
LGKVLGKVLGLTLATSLLAGCVSEGLFYTIDRYGTARVTKVRLGCSDTYEVFDRPDAGTMLVVTNVLNETLVGTCASGPSGLDVRDRLRRTARIFLSETTDRPECRITREVETTNLQTEFAYRCPAPDGPAPPLAARAPRPR